MKVAFFRADASSEIGGGHVYRCLALADALADSGWRCTFVCRPRTRETVPALARSRHTVIDLSTADESGCLRELQAGGADLLVVDHYSLGADFETACRPWARCIVALDDGPTRSHDCDILLDQNLGAQSSVYRNLVPSHCRLLLGPDYALLRPQFPLARGKALMRRAANPLARKLLISLGTTDPMNVTSRVVAATAGLSLEIDVVLGANSAQEQIIRDLASRLALSVRIHVDIADMATLMSAADLAVGAGGSTSWERCCLGLPCLLLILADNHLGIVKSLDQVGAAKNIGAAAHLSEANLQSALLGLITNHEQRDAMASTAAAICDGRGTHRLLLALLQPITARHGMPVTLRRASLTDESTLLEWQRHPLTRRYARNPAVPTAEEHHRWMANKLCDPNCLLTIVECAGEPAGALRLDRRTDREASYEVSILIAPERYRQGIGASALSLARHLLPAAQLVADVLPQNEGSIKLFSSAGYQRHNDGLLYCPSMP